MTIVRDSFYINGQWVQGNLRRDPRRDRLGHRRALRDDPCGHRRRGQRARSRRRRRPSPAWSNTRPKERAEFLTRISEKLAEYSDDLALTIAHEVGMPLMLSKGIQVGLPTMTFADCAQRAAEFVWEEEVDNSTIVREAVGVVAAITPWNYPLHQIANKVAPALAAGCTVVLKPSEVAPDQRLHPRRHHRGGRPARGRLQPRHRPRAGRRRGDRRAPQDRHGLLHRLDARRQARHGDSRPRWSSASPSSSAASRPTSSSRAPTWPRPSPTGSSSATSTPARPARR